MKIRDGIVLNISYMPEDLLLSSKKWDALYREEFLEKSYYKKINYYKKIYFQDVFNQINTIKRINNNRYLEIGCGEFFFGQLISKQCEVIIGVDISKNALRIAKEMMDKRGVKNYLLIQGDIKNMPIKNNCVDIIYGGGVIEHFRDTHSCLTELYRVLRRNGISFNTVPYLNLGSLTYRQLWGNIPNITVLKQIAEFIHIGLLGSKHMTFGYEMSFTRRSLRKLHKKIGFRRVIVDKFTVSCSFEFAPKALRPFFCYLADHSSLFWPMIKAIGVK
jgi:ubiquinone/menaquinone biosynthesis C-methylase UbiE